MLYSAVTQPSTGCSGSLDFRQGGIDFSTLAVHNTIVLPASISTLDKAVFVNPRCTRIGRNWSGVR
jgi:hypothetical protein